MITLKLFELMAMAIPVQHGVEGESTQIMTSEDVGLLFEPENPNVLLGGLRFLTNTPELHARSRANSRAGAKRDNRSRLG